MSDHCICTYYGWPWCEITAGCPVHDPPAEDIIKNQGPPTIVKAAEVIASINRDLATKG